MNFEQFVISKERNAWIQEPGISIYVRRPHPRTRPAGVEFDLATLEAVKPGEGALRRFLERYEPQYGFYIENVLSTQLRNFFVRRGYTVLEPHGYPNWDGPVCLYRARDYSGLCEEG
jgi:hypothetical protein